MSKMYIAVLDEFPDYMSCTLVAHAVLSHHLHVDYDISYGQYKNMYSDWRINSFKKVVIRVNQKEFDKISQLPNVTLSHENNTLNVKEACAVVAVDDIIPNVLKFAKLWEPVRIAGD